MKTVLVTAPAETPITLTEAKAHCVITDSVDDTYLTSLIEVATEHVESVTGRKLVTQTHKLLLNDWPAGDEILFPFGKVSSVTTVAYTDYLGNGSTFSSDSYTVDSDSDHGRLVLKYDKSWPTSSLYTMNPIQITFVCGYGAASAVPDQLKHAVKILAQHWYEHREQVLVGTIVTNIPTTVDALVWPFRVVQF